MVRGLPDLQAAWGLNFIKLSEFVCQYYVDSGVRSECGLCRR